VVLVVCNYAAQIYHAYANETYAEGSISPSLKCRDPVEYLMTAKSELPLSGKHFASKKTK